MKEIIDFLKQIPAFYVATSDENNHPRVRPFSFVMEWDNKLTFATSIQKPFYKQLRNNPMIEICSFNHNSGEWMRLHGAVEFTTDIEAKKKVFDVMPDLRRIYQDENNSDLICFYIKGSADIYSFGKMDGPFKTIEI